MDDVERYFEILETEATIDEIEQSLVGLNRKLEWLALDMRQVPAHVRRN